MENMLGNLMGTHWELERNIMITHWELGKHLKKSFPLHPNLKGKKARHLECMLRPSCWRHEISFPKRVFHHFWPGLIPLTKNTLLIEMGFS
jgi:hypothetical protein